MGGELNGILKIYGRRAVSYALTLLVLMHEVSGAMNGCIGMRIHLKWKYDTAQGSPRVGEEKVPVVTFSAAMKIRLCLLLILQRGPVSEAD